MLGSCCVCGQAGKPEKSTSFQGLDLAGKKMTPRKVLPWSSGGKCRVLPIGTHFLQGQAWAPWVDPSSQGRTSPQAAITVGWTTLEAGYDWALNRITEQQGGHTSLHRILTLCKGLQLTGAKIPIKDNGLYLTVSISTAIPQVPFQASPRTLGSTLKEFHNSLRFQCLESCYCSKVPSD